MNIFKKYRNKRLIKKLNSLYKYKLSIKNQIDWYIHEIDVSDSVYDINICDQVMNSLNYELNTVDIVITQIEKKLAKINN